METGAVDALCWLLEPENPSARYLTLTELLGHPSDAPEVIAARAAIPSVDPVRSILDAQFPGTRSGYWVKPGVGYSPKYRATVWQVIFLAQVGAPSIEPIRQACEYVLDNSRRLSEWGGVPDGRFVAGKGAHNALNCLNGNLIWALRRLGYGADPRVLEAQQATADTLLKRGFGCHYNATLSCAWGAVKVLRAFVEVPPAERSGAVAAASERAVNFLLSVSLLEATYPNPTHVSNRWFRLCFPLAYHADVLEAMCVLAQAGHKDHAYVQNGIEWLRAKRDRQGRWALEQVPGKMWASFGQVGSSNKWVTLRALRLLRAVGQPPPDA